MQSSKIKCIEEICIPDTLVLKEYFIYSLTIFYMNKIYIDHNHPQSFLKKLIYDLNSLYRARQVSAGCMWVFSFITSTGTAVVVAPSKNSPPLIL